MKKSSTTLKLKELRGIGDTVAGKLIDFYGSEASAIQEIAEGKIFSLIEAGLSEKIALKIVRSYKNSLTGEGQEDTLQTQDVNQISSKIIKLIQSYALTSYGKSKILVDIYPTQNKQQIKQNQAIFETACKLMSLNTAQIEKITHILSDFKPLEVYDNFEVKRRIFLTTVPEVLKSLKGLRITSYFQVELIKSFDELKNYDLTDELLLLLTEHDFDETYYPGILVLPENSLETPWINILPEKIMHFFMSNLQTLRNAIELSKTIKLSSEYHYKFPNLLDNSLSSNLHVLETTLQKLNSDGSLKDDIDIELQRLNNILINFENESYNFQAELNELISQKIEKMHIQLEGKKVLEILKTSEIDSNSSNIRDFIDDSVSTIISTEITKIKNKLNSKLNLEPDESEILENLFPSEIQIPIELNDEVFDYFLGYIRKKYDKQEFLELSKMASSLENFRPILEGLVSEIFELDFLLGIGRFANEFSLKLPIFVEQGTGIVFKNALNLFLVRDSINDSKKKNISPVSYQIGNIANEDPARIIILSGANSGGKTSILQLIIQVLILSHMGLGVPSEDTRLSYFDYFYFYQKPTGSADAGAFETALRNFAGMILEKKSSSKFILADEMEAISEPEASARVISAFLDLLQEQEKTCGIFVSHLADQINNFSDNKIRIDGIEATGLDENLELIVDRNPKINYHARSTPQLIVESLIKKSKNQEHEFYKKILDKFSKRD